MNVKRFVAAVAVVFVFIFSYEFLVHGILLKPLYAQTQQFWRKPEDVIFAALFAGQFVLGFFLVALYAACCKTRSWRDGLRFGILLGFFTMAPNLIMYAIDPLPATLYLAWSLAGLIEMSACGAIAGAIYRPVVDSGAA